ncbi:MAG: trehalase family glycosidase [Albidovulum sp.]|nr:trehalase family glycosidase [Albidovulum sp.]
MKPDRWWTWTPDFPAELVHLQSGYRITPILYSSRLERATLLPPGPDIAFRSRSLDGSGAAFSTDFGDTVLDWHYTLPDSRSAALELALRRSGEWGLRYWILVCVRSVNGAVLKFDCDSGALASEPGYPFFEAIPGEPPAVATFHESVEAVAEEIEENGYFFLGSRAGRGRVAAMRFNLEQAPRLRIQISARENCPIPGDSIASASSEDGTPQAALRAVHDVISWNHVWDDTNRRPYTALSRFWNRRKFGGFGVWLNDILFNALMWSHFEPRAAIDNFDAVATWQTSEGNFPCLVTGNDAWLDRSQTPIAACVGWYIYARSRNLEFLERAYPKLVRNNRWWKDRRSLGDSGLVAFGTSAGAGEGLYKGTKLAAKNESAMDNSPLHDPAPFDPESGLLLALDVGLNSMFALDCEMLGLIAAALCKTAEADKFRSEASILGELISKELWDEERGVFANRLLDGSFIRPIAPTSFFPLLAGAATPAQSEAMLGGYFENADKFGGRFAIPSIARDDPAFADNVYWRGRIWGPLNYWCYRGLRRNRFDRLASELARKSQDLFGAAWTKRICGENYNADTGEVFDQPDTDGFYSWGALLPLIAVHEIIDEDPWNGLNFKPPAFDSAFGPIATKYGPLRLDARDGEWEARFFGDILLRGNVGGRLSNLALDKGKFEATLSAGPGGEWLSIPDRRITAVKLGGLGVKSSGKRVTLPVRREPKLLTIYFDGASVRG